MQKLLTPTLALIIAGGLAAGIALARPSSSGSVSAGTPTVELSQTSNGYGQSATDQSSAAAQPSSTQASSGQAAPAAILIKDFAFGGAATVASGQPVTVTNQDTAAHTLTFTSGEVDTGSIDGGASASFGPPTAPGSYAFFCAIHPSMQGELVVQG